MDPDAPQADARQGPDEAWAPQLVDAVVDAVCQGRLTPADVAGLTPSECDALYALGQARLQTGQIDQAVSMFSSLVALDPYQARAWRALGVGQHHAGAMQQAAQAYGAALYLEPGHALTAVYALEVHLLLGHTARAEYLARTVRQSRDVEALHRLQLVLKTPAQTTSGRQQAASPPVAAPDKRAAKVAEQTTTELGFCLADGRPLPLTDSAFAPAGDSNETTLIFDLAQATHAGVVAEARAEAQAEDEAPPTQASLPPAPRITAFVPPKERTLTAGAYIAPLSVLPEATAARRLGMMLTDELTLGPDATDASEQTTQHRTTAAKGRGTPS